MKSTAAWLLRDGEVLASLEVPATLVHRGIGLIGRRELDGAMLLERTRSVHGIGVRFRVDVAFLDAELVVLATTVLPRCGVALPRRHTRAVLEAPAGAFDRWRLVAGDRLEVRHVNGAA